MKVSLLDKAIIIPTNNHEIFKPINVRKKITSKPDIESINEEGILLKRKEK